MISRKILSLSTKVRTWVKRRFYGKSCKKSEIVFENLLISEYTDFNKNLDLSFHNIHFFRQFVSVYFWKKGPKISEKSAKERVQPIKRKFDTVFQSYRAFSNSKEVSWINGTC